MPDFERLNWTIAHDPCRPGDRSPVGPVLPGQDIFVMLRVSSTALPLVESVDVLFTDGAFACTKYAMVPCADGFYATLKPMREPHVGMYVFRLAMSDGSTRYYVPCADGRSSAGEVVRPGVDGEWTDAGWAYSAERLDKRPMGGFGLAEPLPGFQITVYEPWFATPDWLSGAIMYQIFPDRFARGSGGVRRKGLAYHRRVGRPVRLHESWDDSVEWKGEIPEKTAAKIEDSEELLEAEMKAYDPIDFFGGTLAGIREKLPYLASLGVEVLYLNPVFEARSNHRYDTADYERIDPLLGDRKDFEDLVAAADELGIAIVLDAVLSHTGDDSRYFNAKGVYDEAGAFQGPESPFYSWYDFTEQSDGTPYRSWWGHLSLPEVDERDASWQRYILGYGASDDSPAGGVLGSWIAAGARGYRLDVADEIPDDVLERIRTCVKSVNPEACVIGEVWEDPTTKTSYGVPRTYALGRSLDSVMNYPLRNALVGYALGSIDAHQLVTFLKSQQANYPQPMYSCLMNLLSTHDVERIRSVLALQGPIKQFTRDEQIEMIREITPSQDDRAALLQQMIVALMYALPGTPCIYYGDERGLQGGGDPFCRSTFPWHSEAERSDCGRDLMAFYQQVGQLRKSSELLRTGAMACTAPQEDVVCVVRTLSDSKRRMVAASNRSADDRVVVVDARTPELAIDLGKEPASCSVALATGEDPTSASMRCESGMIRLEVPALSTVFYDVRCP